MSIGLGSIVKLGESMGIVIKKSKANEGSHMSSSHGRSLIEQTHDVFYVFFSDKGRKGPFFAGELTQVVAAAHEPPSD